MAASPNESGSSPRRLRFAGLALAALTVAGLSARPCLAATDRDVAAAARCYANADLACVVERLQASSSQRPERWRLLAFAAARLDRHQLARQAFTAWIRLAPGHRLQRDVTPPAIWRDYAAALITAHANKLDLRPRVEPPATLPPAAATQTSLPRFAPPPRSSRDHNTDFAIWLGGVAGLAWQADDPAAGVELTVAANLAARWRLGFQLTMLRYPAEATTVPGDVTFILPGVLASGGVRADLLLVQGVAGELGVAGGLGFAMLDWDDGRSESVAAIRPALRYAWPARQRSSLLALWLEISHGFLVGNVRSRQFNVIGLGLELRPGSGASAPKKR